MALFVSDEGCWSPHCFNDLREMSPAETAKSERCEKDCTWWRIAACLRVIHKPFLSAMLNNQNSMLLFGPGSSVGISTGYGLDCPGIESRWRPDFPHMSRPALGPTQPPVQWVPGLSPEVNSGRGVTLTPHPLLVPWSWKSRAIPLLPLWAVRPVESLSACTKVHFTFLPRHTTKDTVTLYRQLFFVIGNS